MVQHASDRKQKGYHQQAMSQRAEEKHKEQAIDFSIVWLHLLCMLLLTWLAFAVVAGRIARNNIVDRIIAEEIVSVAICSNMKMIKETNWREELMSDQPMYDDVVWLCWQTHEIDLIDWNRFVTSG